MKSWFSLIKESGAFENYRIGNVLTCGFFFSLSLLRWTQTLSPSPCVLAAWPIELSASWASTDVWNKSRDLILPDASLRLRLALVPRSCRSHLCFLQRGRERRRCLDWARQSAFIKQRGHSVPGQTKLLPTFVSQRAIRLWIVPRTVVGRIREFWAWSLENYGWEAILDAAQSALFCCERGPSPS